MSELEARDSATPRESGAPATRPAKRPCPAGTTPTPTPAPRLQCEFYLEKKHRRCGMSRPPDVVYCSEHLTLLQGAAQPASAKGRRVPCPLDPRHTIWEKDVARHTRKCNTTKQATRPRAAEEPWFRADYNAEPEPAAAEVPGSADPAAAEAADPGAADAAVLAAIPVLSRCIEAAGLAPSLELVAKRNAAVESRRFPQLQGSRKHARQQSSLIQHMLDAGLFPRHVRDPLTYLEFGCGRAELSRYVNQSVFAHQTALDPTCAHTLQPPSFVLVDRASNRMKFDKKFRDDLDELYAADRPAQPPAHAHVLRKKIDIKDLILDRLLEPPTAEDDVDNDIDNDIDNDAGADIGDCVAISKHLCGVATDLSLRCCVNSDVLHGRDQRLRGMVIAMCCRHVCDANQYVNRPFVERMAQGSGLSYAAFFGALKKIATWAVCGRQAGVGDEVIGGHFSGLSVAQRERLGEQARRVIDEGRAQFLREHGYRVSLVRYVEPAVSLENVAMVVQREGDT
ncbi:LAQU0S23e01178g1_1 [Lachancea quebecensis]|uniref:tRNA:m(4)X modification enzyme TRM13 n=1 Tax=Lachancea quebecensis TaxID=1654605 RepID=A0A0P1KZU4_9SACH|nr:LAQU0S23e01178g1_1 [Lachancea quebecensis]